MFIRAQQLQIEIFDQVKVSEETSQAVWFLSKIICKKHLCKALHTSAFWFTNRTNFTYRFPHGKWIFENEVENRPVSPVPKIDIRILNTDFINDKIWSFWTKIHSILGILRERNWHKKYLFNLHIEDIFCFGMKVYSMIIWWYECFGLNP